MCLAGHRQQVSPFDDSGQGHERVARRLVRVARADAALQIAGELFAEEEILGGQSRPTLEHRYEQSEYVPISPEAVWVTCSDDTVPPGAILG
jgi:hypothetical protein